MSSEIVEQLRMSHPTDNGYAMHQKAADTIEHLNDMITRFMADNEKLRGEVVVLLSAVKMLTDGIELAYSLLANGEYWDRTDDRQCREWNDARLKWRNEHWTPRFGSQPGGSF